MKKIVTALLSLIIFFRLSAQTITPQQYVEMYKDISMAEMSRMGVPAAITLAQGILETESGNSLLVKKSNNHFGIKCKASWTGESVSHDDDALGECFRKYKNSEDSYRDHSNYLRSGNRYASLFNLDPTDYKAWAYGLKKAGYATNPRYPEILIKNIEKYNLNQYTLLAIRNVPIFDEGKYIDKKNGEATIAIKPDVKVDLKLVQNPSEVIAGKTYFNKLKAVFSNKGTSLLAIATLNNIPLAKLLEYNDLKTDGLLSQTQYIYLEPKAKEGNRDFYIVQQKDETLYDIAQTNGIQISYLLDYNSIPERALLTPGKKVYLRPVKNIAETSSTINEKVHKVQLKEGLYVIAKKYNVSVDQLKEWNSLTTESLIPGQQLIISK